MGDFIGSKCPVCEQTLAAGEDIVVCPKCGAPYHRACYQKVGHCLFEQADARGESWQASQNAQTPYDGDAALRCPKCGAPHPPEGLFCQICGYRLHDGAAGTQQEEIPTPISPNAYTTPFGGVPPEEELGGIPVRELALYVGENSFYFIPHFKALARGARSSGWNWPAFLFGGFYYLYRKRYVMGALLLLLTALLTLPSLCYTLAIFSGSPPPAAALLTLSRLQMAANLLSVGLCTGCALFFNRGYFRQALRQAKKLRANADIWSQEYALALTKKGRTNRAVVAVLIGGLFILTSLCSLYLSFSVW